MNDKLKLFVCCILFITTPIWVVPAALVFVACMVWVVIQNLVDDFSEYLK